MNPAGMSRTAILALMDIDSWRRRSLMSAPEREQSRATAPPAPAVAPDRATPAPPPPAARTPAPAARATPAHPPFEVHCQAAPPCLFLLGRTPAPDGAALLRNIAAALGLGLAAPSVLRWPPPVGDGGPGAARAALAAFLQDQWQGCQQLLIFGEAAATLLCPKKDGQLATDIAADPAPAPIILPTLEQMLENPQAKAECWRLLRPLAPAP